MSGLVLQCNSEQHSELLDQLQKQICRIVGPPLAASLEPLANCQSIASLSLLYVLLW